MRLKITAGIATLTATAALAGAAPAQAQGDYRCIERDTPADGQICYDGDAFCVGGICAYGVGNNVKAAREILLGAVAEVTGSIPGDEVCTPDLLAGPICAGG